MLKVFLVEDEFIIREGIKKNIKWQENGYEFCGEASDGELAFPMIQKLKPDIVITDIKMPFMDGLMLSRLIKKELPWIEIIILTGYGEFEYAKEAIKLGVAQYLLKPINGEELLKEVNTVATKIEERQKEYEIREKYLKEMEENFLKERMDLFQYLATGQKSAAELLELSAKLEIDISALWYNIVLIKTRSMNHEYSEYSGSVIEAESKIKELEDEKHLLVFDRALEGKALLFKADTEEELIKYQTEYLNKWKEQIEEYPQIRYFGGIGIPVNRLRELPLSFEKASHAFAHRYLVNENTILDSRKMEPKLQEEQDDFQISEVNTRQLDRTKLQEFLKLGNKDEVIYFIEEFFKDLGENALKSKIFRQYITMDVYFCIVDFVDNLGFSKEEIETPDIELTAQQTKEEAEQYVIRIMKKALELREKKASGRYEDVVDEVIRYIEKNYADEELSLNTMASQVNFSPNHLSMIFSQQTGQTLIKYLTDYRINKAKELLRCTGKRSSVISMEVGYKDPHYFSYLFKKSVGMTPTQYREGKGLEEE